MTSREHSSWRSSLWKELPNVTHVWPQQDKQNDSRFRNLQQVSVKSCRKLKALFPVAIATNLKMLEQLEVHFCDELREIVEKDSGGGGETKKFVFLYLTRLRLYNLPQLAHFYDGMFTFECPELNILYPFNCNKFDLFQTPQGNSPPITRPPLFSNIKDISKVKTLSMKSKDTWVLKSWLQQSEDLELEYLRGLMLTFDDDCLLTSSAAGSLKHLEELYVYDCKSLKDIVQKEQDDETATEEIIFEQLKRISLQHLRSLECFYQGNAALKLPSLAQTALFLNNYPELEGKWVGSSEIPVEWSLSLQVRKCKHVEAIFDVKDTSAKHDDPVTFRLRTIVLKELPSMRHVWNNDPKASPFSFPFLEGVGVQECKRIKNLFPASVPRDYLRHLDVRKCGELEEIVAKDEAFPQDANNKEIDMLFPQLTFMVLWALPELRCICSGMQNLLDQSVVLTRLYVFSCPKLKAFAADIA
ncbi:uncharacterized protein [Arachis hypogaea]|uniref:uncharacterized protein n=1 Tax=Arachis hypogaea TaxID=3818 RepID=UPI003B210036